VRGLAILGLEFGELPRPALCNIVCGDSDVFAFGHLQVALWL
jgi:hypothetical protein